MSDLPSMKDFWNRTAKKFGDKNGYRPVLIPSSKGLLNWYTDYLQRTALSDVIKRLLGKRVLDVGCGVGRWSARLAAAGAQVVGIDLSREMAKAAKKRIATRKLSNVNFVVASASKLPFVSQAFDASFSVTVLQHIVDEATFRSAVLELIQTTKSDGQIDLLEFVNDKGRNPTLHFPAVTHDYKKAITDNGGFGLAEVQGVDLSLFLKPFNSIMKKHGKYRNLLEARETSLRYRLSADSFYFLASIACVLSLPLDLALRNIFLQSSEHKIFIFRAISFEEKKSMTC